MEIDRYEEKSHNETVNGMVVEHLRRILYSWQEECLEVWLTNNGRGIVNVVTGAGKTVLALGAIERLTTKLSQEGIAPLKVKIIVPKVFLAYQWENALRHELGVAKADIGIYSGVRKDKDHRKFMIYVVNSARYTLTKHMISEYENGNTVMLIADECHRYGSDENGKIFDFVFKVPALIASDRYFALGLSATPETVNYQEKIVPALGQEIYKYGFSEALNANIISSFAIFNIRLNFSWEEAKEYEELTDELTITLGRMRRRCPHLFRFKRSQFFASLQQLAQNSREAGLAELARALLVISYRRKEVVYRAAARIGCVLNLLAGISQTSKVLIFSERIDTAEILYEKLLSIYPNQVGCYHSKIDNATRRNTLNKYNEEKLRILVACKALDEGLNVPETDVGIIVSSTSANRQRIQRLGRILRRSKGADTARLYYLYIGASNEEQELLSDINKEMKGVIPILELEYDEDAPKFNHAGYQILVERVLTHARQKNWPHEIINEIERNLELGKLACDWWASEETCKLKIESATSQAERNYWQSMGLLIQARMKRL